MFFYRRKKFFNFFILINLQKNRKVFKVKVFFIFKILKKIKQKEVSNGKKEKESKEKEKSKEEEKEKIR